MANPHLTHNSPQTKVRRAVRKYLTESDWEQNERGWTHPEIPGYNPFGLAFKLQSEKDELFKETLGS